MPLPLQVGDKLYFISDVGILSYVEAGTGKLHWHERIGGNYSAFPVAVDGRSYVFREEGTTTAVAPGKQYRRLATS